MKSYIPTSSPSDFFAREFSISFEVSIFLQIIEEGTPLTHYTQMYNNTNITMNYEVNIILGF